MKKYLLAIFLILLLASSVYAVGPIAITSPAPAAAGCSDHVVEIQANGATAQTLGDGTSAWWAAQTFVPGNAGTIKTIEVYTTGTTTDYVTLRWKHRTSGTDYDLTSYIDSLIVHPVDSGYTMFNVTDTVVGATDLYMMGIALTTGTAGDVQIYRNDTGTYAGGIELLNAYTAHNSWVISDADDEGAADLRVRFTICY